MSTPESLNPEIENLKKRGELSIQLKSFMLMDSLIISTLILLINKLDELRRSLGDNEPPHDQGEKIQKILKALNTSYVDHLDAKEKLEAISSELMDREAPLDSTTN